MPTPEENEKYYDEEIAPVLRFIAETCQARGISFLAFVEWAPDSGGTTIAIQEDAGAGLHLTWMAARARGNLDGLVTAVHAYAKKNGHSSLVLSLFETPSLRKDSDEDAEGI